MDIITNGCFMVGGRIKVTGTLQGTGTLSVPAGVTEILLTGQGGAGVYNNKYASPASAQVTNMLNTLTPVSNRYYLGLANVVTWYDVGNNGSVRVNAMGGLSYSGFTIMESFDGTSYGRPNPQYMGVKQGVNYECAVGPSQGSANNSYIGANNWALFDQQLNLTYYMTYGCTMYYTMQIYAAGYTQGPSTTVSQAQSTNGTKTWSGSFNAQLPSIVQQTMTLSGAAATLSYSTASGTTISYEYML